MDLQELLALLDRWSQAHVLPAPATPGLPLDRGAILPVRVLLVEDTPINQTLATIVLTRMGCEVTVVNNGLEAVAAFAAGDFDVVLMDIQMPEMGASRRRRRSARSRPVRGANPRPSLR